MFSDDDVKRMKDSTPAVPGTSEWLSDARCSAIMHKTAELLAARGGTMTAEELELALAEIDRLKMPEHWPHDYTATVAEHISALGARNAVLEKERDELRDSLIEAARFEMEWAFKDGNSPGYNNQKAQNYGRQANEFRLRAERAEERVKQLTIAGPAPDQQPANAQCTNPDPTTGPTCTERGCEGSACRYPKAKPPTCTCGAVARGYPGRPALHLNACPLAPAASCSCENPDCPGCYPS